MFMFSLNGAISGFAISGFIGGLISINQGNLFVVGFAEAAVNGFIIGFYTSSILFCVAQAVRALFIPAIRYKGSKKITSNIHKTISKSNILANSKKVLLLIQNI